MIIPKKGIQYYITKDDDTLKTVSNIFNAKENDIVSQNKSIYLLPGQMIFYKEDWILFEVPVLYKKMNI